MRGAADPTGDPRILSLDEFIAWLERNELIPGAPIEPETPILEGLIDSLGLIEIYCSVEELADGASLSVHHIPELHTVRDLYLDYLALMQMSARSR
jgi:hypothetical protein